MPGLRSDTLAEVLSTLRLLPRWELDMEGWALIESHLRRLEIAMTRGDERLAHAALDDIDRLGPARLASIARSAPSLGEGPEARIPPPEPVLEILNALVHPAGGWGSTPAGDADPDEG